MPIILINLPFLSTILSALSLIQIIVDKNEGGYPQYTRSKFVSPGTHAIPEDIKIEDIYENMFELDKSSSFDHTDVATIKNILEEHVLGESISISKPSSETSSEIDDDQIPGLDMPPKKEEEDDVFEEKEETKSEEEASDTASNSNDDLDDDLDDDLKNLLSDL